MASSPRRSQVDTAARYYSLAEAARVLGVHYETAARWARSGKLAAVKLSRRKVLVPKEGCGAILTGCVGSGAEVGAVHRWAPLIGTLSPKEAARLRELASDFEKIDDED